MADLSLPKTEITIKDTRYEISALPGAVGEKALVRLLRAFGPVFATAARESAAVEERHLLDGVVPEQLKPLVEIYASTAGVEAFCRALTEEDLSYFTNLFYRYTEVWGGEGFVPLTKRAGPNGAFVRDYGALFQLLQAHLEWNYADFLADMGGILKPAPAPKAAAPSPKG